MVHVYSWYPENEAPVFLYNVMLVGSDDCEQVSGPLPDPPHCTGVLSGQVHCPPPVPLLLPASTQWSGLAAVRELSLITAVCLGRQ